VTSDCVAKIAEIIEDQGLGVGDRLPGERALAQEIGCSRNTVREALLKLAAQGHIAIRRRSGCYLTAPAHTEGWKSLRGNPAHAPAAYEAFITVCPSIAVLAAPHCTPEKAQRLETITSRLGRTLVNGDARRTITEYINFFIVLAGMTRNPYLEMLIKEISAAGKLSATSEMDKSDIETFFALHINLLQALGDRDAGLAASIAPRCLSAFGALLGKPAWPALDMTERGEK